MYENLNQAQTLKQFAVSCQVISQWEESWKQLSQDLKQKILTFHRARDGIKSVSVLSLRQERKIKSKDIKKNDQKK